MKPFEELLTTSSEAHGHLCPGQVVGVRTVLLGCKLIGLDDPTSRAQIKKLIVFMEMDRCTGDAVAHFTGVKLGRRSLKFMDYGIMAAAFVNLETGKAYRIVSTEESRDLAALYAPEIGDKRKQQVEAYKRMPTVSGSGFRKWTSLSVNLIFPDLPIGKQYVRDAAR